MSRKYRNWDVSYVNPPIPVRNMDWQATHPDYDPTPVHSDDGPSDNRSVSAGTYEGITFEIDDWIAENEPVFDAAFEAETARSFRGDDYPTQATACLIGRLQAALGGDDGRALERAREYLRIYRETKA